MAALNDRLAQMDELTKRTAAQYDSLRQSRQDLDALRKEIHDFHRSHAEVSQLRDRLAADRASLEAFGERMSAFMARTPQLESTMDAINAKLALVDAGTKTA